MASRMPTRFDQFNARNKFSITIDEPVKEIGMVPMLVGQGKSYMSPGPRGFVVGALDNKLGPRKFIMVARAIRIEMGADQEVDITWGKSEVCKRLNNIAQKRLLGVQRVIFGQSRIDENICAITGLNQIPRNGRAIFSECQS
jgi:hypothetical protein